MDWVTFVSGSKSSFAWLNLERDASPEKRFGCCHVGCIDCDQACEDLKFCGWPKVRKYRNEEEYSLHDQKREVLIPRICLNRSVGTR